MKPPVCQYDFKDPDLRGHGCTLASLTYAAREMGADIGDPEAYAGRLQRLSGVPLATFRDRGTTITEARTAYAAAPGFEGRVGPRLRVYRGGSVRLDLLPELRAGRIAVVAVNYGVLQDAIARRWDREGAKRGVGSFRGGHAITVGDPQGDSVAVADPLRRDLITIKVDLLERAMERFGKNPWMNGRGEFAVIQPSPTWQAKYREAKRLLDKAEQAAADAITAKGAAEDALAQEKAAHLLTQQALDAANARIAELEGEPHGVPVDTIPMEFSYADYAVIDGFATLPDGTRIASTSDVVRVPVLSTAA